jgi:hypothetical protein
MKAVTKLVTVLAVGGIVGALGTAVPAMAETSTTDPQVETVPMHGVPVTEANALEFGYEIRTDQAGVRYAVYPGTAAGDFSRAVPLVADPAPGTVTPRNTIYGDCGYAWVYFTGTTTYKTGYQIYTTFGNTINFSWSVAFTSSIDAISVPDGSPFATQRWEVKRAHGAQALPGTNLSAVAGGNVLTTGGICFAGAPYDTVTW